jgi:outer membrane protein assembly factor BamB
MRSEGDMNHRGRAWLAALFAVVLGGCGSMNPLDWFGSGGPVLKPAELTPFTPRAELRPVWQGSAGSGGHYSFTPAIEGQAVYAASHEGRIVKFDAKTGAEQWRVDTGRKLSAGVGLGTDLVLVATEEGEVLAYDKTGQPRWQSRVSSEVLDAPQSDGRIVVVRAQDGRIFGLNPANGERRWVHQRPLPALIVRAPAGLLLAGGAVFAGYPGGRLVAIRAADGVVGWEAGVALPRGASELERVADVVGRPVADAEQVCAVAYQGRLACFDANKGSLLWARDLSSATGLDMDRRAIYVTDAEDAVLAFEKRGGASLWKQDKLLRRKATAPLSLGNSVAVGDFEGVVHLMSAEDGSFVARANTDSSGIRVQPLLLGDGLLAQTANGGVYALQVR